MTTSIWFVIQPGQPIPDDVTAFTALDGDTAVRTEGLEYGAWSAAGCGPQCIGHAYDDFQYPLRVTAVREQPAESVSGLCEVGTDKVTCIVMDADHRRIYHGRRPVPPYASTEALLKVAEPQQPADAVPPEHFEEPVRIIEPLNINGLIRDSREIMALLGVTEPADVLPELARRLAAPEPQQADASPLLDLARQYAQRWAAFCVTKVGGNDGASDKAKADALLARIAALVPQQPVQARDAHGNLWWIHDCGEVAGDSERPGPDWCGQADPESWRPLLVGGDPAPEPTESRAAYWERRFNEEAARGDQAAQQILTLHRERDEARAEVEHERKNAAYLHEIIAEFKAAQPDSLVLSLPEVPEGTEALVGESSGARYPWNAELQGWLFDQAEIGTTGLGELLDREGSVRVELAPPREPRTAAEIWAEMPDAQATVRGLSGELAEALDREAGL